MNPWKSDVKSWAISNNRDPKIVENILCRGGWDPKKYSNKMRGDLYRWLDDWYTLSVKKLAKPATSYLRRNPIEVCNECGGIAIRCTTCGEDNCPCMPCLCFEEDVCDRCGLEIHYCEVCDEGNCFCLSCFCST